MLAAVMAGAGVKASNIPPAPSIPWRPDVPTKRGDAAARLIAFGRMLEQRGGN